MKIKKRIAPQQTISLRKSRHYIYYQLNHSHRNLREIEPKDINKRKHYMSDQVIPLIIISLILLPGCATNKIHIAENVKTDNKGNIVFMGYDIVIPDTRITNIHIQCSSNNIKKNKRCFNIPITPGKTTYKGASTYKMDFGEYKIDSIVFEIKTGKKTTQLTNGTILTTNLTDTISINADSDKKFIVSKIISPYVGRLYTDIDQDRVSHIFADKKSGGKMDISEIINGLKLKFSNKFPEDLLLEKESVRHALKRHINFPPDRNSSNESYNQSIKCDDTQGFFMKKTSCKIRGSKKSYDDSSLSREYSFSFSSSGF